MILCSSKLGQRRFLVGAIISNTDEWKEYIIEALEVQPIAEVVIEEDEEHAKEDEGRADEGE
jgi:carbamoylphosphate synthase large subunit